MIARVFRRQHGKKLINRAARALIHTFPTAANAPAVTSLQGGLTSLLVELTSLRGEAYTPSFDTLSGQGQQAGWAVGTA